MLKINTLWAACHDRIENPDRSVGSVMSRGQLIFNKLNTNDEAMLVIILNF